MCYAALGDVPVGLILYRVELGKLEAIATYITSVDGNRLSVVIDSVQSKYPLSCLGRV